MTPVKPGPKNDPLQSNQFLPPAAAFLNGRRKLISVSFERKTLCGVPFLYDRSGFPGSPGSYGPSNSKMAIFCCFWIFRQLKSMQMGKSEIAQTTSFPTRKRKLSNAQAQTTSFPTIPNLLRLDRAPLSYGPGVVKDPKTLH